MDKEEEKQLLGAILSGKITPDDAIWQEIWEQSHPNYARYSTIRKQLLELDALTEMDFEDRGSKMWSVVSSRCKKNSIRLSVRSSMKWAAILLLPLCLATSFLFLYQHKSNSHSEHVVAEVMLQDTFHHAVLVLNDGRRVQLSALNADSLLRLSGDQVQIHVDANKLVSYQNSGLDAMNPSALQPVEYNTLIVPRGGEYQLLMADGTKVWLNSESELRYPTRFDGEIRRVFLKGEVYFQVAHDENRPFVVETDKMAVTVLGTEFAIRAYANEAECKATLVRGAVKVENKLDNEQVVLQPNQQACISAHDFSVNEVNVKYATAWRDGLFYFKANRLEDIAAQIHRWYDVDFFYTSNDCREICFSGVIKKDYSIQKVFEMIEKTSSVRFKLTGRTVVVRKR